MPASKAKRKRPLLEEDPPSSSSLPFLTPLPTPDVSAFPPACLPPVERQGWVPAGPANPGLVRDRSQDNLSRLPNGSDAFETFARLRSEDSLTDEEAFMKLITTYDV